MNSLNKYTYMYAKKKQLRIKMHSNFTRRIFTPTSPTLHTFVLIFINMCNN